MTNAFIFPGQGSQKVGMGKDLYDNFPVAKEVFQEVDDALMAVSFAIVRIIENFIGKNISEVGKFTAGHSLGEYSALVSARSIKLKDAAKILRLRGEFMQNAVPLNIGAMAALIGVNTNIVEEIRSKYVEKDEIIDIGNDNAPGQFVISGHNSIVDKVIANHKAFGIKRAIKLPVSAPFHCRLMEKARENMESYIQDLDLLSPKLILVNNVGATPLTETNKIKDSLVEQITNTVRWRESIDNMCDLGVDNFIEIGAGNVLSGLVKRINKTVNSSSIQNIENIENYINILEG